MKIKPRDIGCTLDHIDRYPTQSVSIRTIEHQLIEYFDTLIDQHGLRADLQPLVPIQVGDLIVDSSGRHLFYGMVREQADSNFASGPSLVQRLKQDVSRMWFTDYLDHASESEGLLENLLRDWRQTSKHLKNVTVTMPSLKRDQVACSIAIRASLLTYRQEILYLCAQREPFSKILPLYLKRTAAVRAIHNELLDEICAIQEPLPFFLEYPYRQFRREDDLVKRIRAGQRLLGVFAKVPLFLVTEELIEKNHPLGSSVLAKLEERPLSDGALVDLQHWLAKELYKASGSPIVVFRELVKLLGQKGRLENLVAARNRMHHEPYDEIGFLKMLDEEAPLAIQDLRNALREIRFIIPQHGKVVDGRMIITAEDVCSPEAHFRTVELPVSLPLESFPSDNLVAWCQAPEKAVSLARLLTSKLILRQSRDFGIFDRVQKNQRQVTFLRSEES